jgi:hypothetical protein
LDDAEAFNKSRFLYDSFPRGPQYSFRVANKIGSQFSNQIEPSFACPSGPMGVKKSRICLWVSRKLAEGKTDIFVLFHLYFFYHF